MGVIFSQLKRNLVSTFFCSIPIILCRMFLNQQTKKQTQQQFYGTLLCFLLMPKLRRVLMYPFFRPLEYLVDNILLEKQEKNMYLQNNFGPIHDEVYQENIKDFQGQIPIDINGAYIRNGPNPFFSNIPRYHWFDGDGKLHAIRIKNGNLNYFSRQLRTNKLKFEIESGRCRYLKIGDLYGFPGLLKIFLMQLEQTVDYIPNVDSLQIGTANTALIFHRKLYALVESNLPLHIHVQQNGELKEKNYDSFQNKLQHPCTAHPKVDKKTGDIIMFGYQIRKKPWLTYSIADKFGNLHTTIPIDLRFPVMMHDCSITQNYTIFAEYPMIFDPQVILEKKVPFQMQYEKGARYGFIPRYAKNQSELIWISTPSHYVFHFSNSWEELEENGDILIKLYGCKYDVISLDKDNFKGPNNLDSSHLDNGQYDVLNIQEHPFNNSNKGNLTEFIFNLNTKKCVVNILLPNYNVDFPVINIQYMGYKNRYTYIATFPENQDQENKKFFNGFLKYDFQDKKVIYHLKYEEACYGGEMVFQPREGTNIEDDGYVMGYIHDYNSSQSYFVVYDAQTSEQVLKVKLPSRVPFGFHGTFLDEKDLQNQLNL